MIAERLEFERILLNFALLYQPCEPMVRLTAVDINMRDRDEHEKRVHSKMRA